MCTGPSNFDLFKSLLIVVVISLTIGVGLACITSIVVANLTTP